MYQEFSAILNAEITEVFLETRIGNQLKAVFKLLLHKDQFQLHASLMAWLGLSEAGINHLFPALDNTLTDSIQPQTLPLF